MTSIKTKSKTGNAPTSRMAIFVIVLMLLAAIGSVSYLWARRFSHRQEWVTHTYQILSEMNALNAALSDASSASRGFVVSGDPAMAAQFESSAKLIKERLDRVQALTSDNPREQLRLGELRPLVDARIAMWRNANDLRLRVPGDSGEQTILLQRGSDLDGDIASILAGMRNEEVSLLHDRNEQSNTMQRRFTAILVISYLLVAGVLAILFFVLTSEVDRRTRAEARAKENEDRFRLLIGAVQDYAIVRLDLDGRITTWNRGAERMFGYSSGEILGKPLHHLFQVCDHDTPVRHLSTALKDGHIQDDCQQVRNDGSVFWVTADLTLVRDELGRPQGYALITRDITERRQYLKDIEERDAQLNAFFSNAPVGLAIIDSDLRFQRVNGPFSKINGLSEEGGEGTPVQDVTSEAGAELESLIQRVADTGEPVLNREVKGQQPGAPGSTGWWLKSFFPITKQNESVTQIGAIVQDITALKRAESTVRWLSGRLLQSRDDERRRLARDLHDSLGQILTAVKMDLSYLGRESVPLDERGRKAVAESKELIDTCIKEVRTLSHLLHPPMLDEVGLLPAIRWFVNGFSDRSGIQVTLELPPSLQRLPVESEIAIFRAMQESLTNVHRHSGSKTARVSLETTDHAIFLEVADDGTGIPPQKLTSRQENSVIGIGILGMRERMRQLGGQMEIVSESRGTTVKVTLPLEASS